MRIANTVCDKCGEAKILWRYPSGKNQWKCRPCDIAKDRERRIATREGRLPECSPKQAKIKPIWQPSWAANGKRHALNPQGWFSEYAKFEEIVAAVRDYRRAMKSLGVRG